MKRNNRFETTDASTYQLLLDKAREMRKNPTEAESLLWHYLSDNKLGVHFRRQHPVYGYIPDFVSLKNQIIIEIDGGYHFEGEQPEKDAERNEYLQEAGFTVLRFTNEEVLCDIDTVIEKITDELEDDARTHQTLPDNRDMRVGFGYDVHRIVEGRELWMGGIKIPFYLPSCKGGAVFSSYILDIGRDRGIAGRGFMYKGFMCQGFMGQGITGRV